jgi:hypothetical protein
MQISKEKHQLFLILITSYRDAQLGLGNTTLCTEAGVLKKLSLAGSARPSRLRYT